MGYTEQEQEIKAAIVELDKAIEFFRQKNTELNEKSYFYWNLEFDELSSTIDKLCEARKSLEARVTLYERLQSQLITMERLREAVNDTDALAKRIIDSHNAYVNWR